VTRDPRDERDARILDVIRALGEGEVTTYGDVAEVAGHPKLSRLVGRLLSAAGETGDELPWWRVVNAAGRLVPGHEREQAALLRAEDVTVRDGRVVAAPIGRFARVSGSGRP
jgi:methylated-DNA-protein-cysteine methyltransferase-like protein